MTDLGKGKIVVTGGAGFIGSAVVWELNRRGLTNILVVDFLDTDEKWRNLVPLQFLDYIEADDFLNRIEDSPQLFGDVSCTFHLGACTSTTEQDAAYLIRNNFEYTKKLAQFALSAGRRFVYASSAATYGALEAQVSETIPLESLRPLNMYAYSKHLFDRYAERTGMLPRIAGLKYFNVFGPNEDHKGDMRSVVRKAFEQAQTGSVKLFNSYRAEFAHGEQRRDFVYVKDAAAATVFLAEYEKGGGLFNIGSGEANTWLALIEGVFEALGREPQIAFVEMPESIRDRYQYFTCADIGKLRAAGYDQPITPLKDAVADYVKNYLVPRRRLGEEKPS